MPSPIVSTANFREKICCIKNDTHLLVVPTKEGRVPVGILKMVGVGDDQLFEVDDIGDKEKVDAKKDNESNVRGSLRQGQWRHELIFYR